MIDEDKIRGMAKEAGMLSINDRGLYGDFVNFERFAALVRAEVLAEPVKHEPVAITVLTNGLQYGVEFLDQVSVGTKLYAAPVSCATSCQDAKAIRAEALEEAAKKCMSLNYGSTRSECAAAIRKLK